MKIIEHLKSRETYYKQAKITVDAANPDMAELTLRIREYFSAGNPSD